MQSQTLGLKHTPNKRLSSQQVQRMMTLRKQGLTCKQITEITGIGESTVARYTSDWYQKKKGGIAELRPKKELSPEAIAYINGIYRSGNKPRGTKIGNLLILIGKFFGGHYPV